MGYMGQPVAVLGWVVASEQRVLTRGVNKGCCHRRPAKQPLSPARPRRSKEPASSTGRRNRSRRCISLGPVRWGCVSYVSVGRICNGQVAEGRNWRGDVDGVMPGMECKEAQSCLGGRSVGRCTDAMRPAYSKHAMRVLPSVIDLDATGGTQQRQTIAFHNGFIHTHSAPHTCRTPATGGSPPATGCRTRARSPPIPASAAPPPCRGSHALSEACLFGT